MSTRIVTFHGVTLGVSEYSIPALDVAAADGAVRFLTPTGVYQLEGNVEATATPYVLTGKLHPVDQEYNAPKITLGINGGDGDLLVQTITNEQGAEQVNGEIETPLSTGADQYEVVLGTGNTARTYQIKIGLPSGARLFDSELYINPVRHRRG